MSIRFRNHRICPVPRTNIPFRTCQEHNHELVQQGDNVDALMIRPLEKGGTQAPSNATPGVFVECPDSSMGEDYAEPDNRSTPTLGINILHISHLVKKDRLGL